MSAAGNLRAATLGKVTDAARTARPAGDPLTLTGAEVRALHAELLRLHVLVTYAQGVVEQWGEPILSEISLRDLDPELVEALDDLVQAHKRNAPPEADEVPG